MKRIIALLLVLTVVFTLGACSSGGDTSRESDKLSIVCTIFPIYDWVRMTVGDSEDVELTLLLDSGVDLHSYQPTAQDIVKISSCDMFIYIGGESDKWADGMLESGKNENRTVMSLLDVLGDDAKLEEAIDGMQTEEEEDEEEEYDEHIWLSLRNAEKCVNAISKALAEKDSENAEKYSAGADAYVKKLSELDKKYAEAAKKGKKDTVLFADRYPFRYLFDDYGINAYAAFSGCSAESEASFLTISFLATKINELSLTTVLTTEASDGKIASTVINNTYDKNMKVLAMDSLQSKTSKDIKLGVTYLSVMEKNLEIFTQALA